MSLPEELEVLLADSPVCVAHTSSPPATVLRPPPPPKLMLVSQYQHQQEEEVVEDDTLLQESSVVLSAADESLPPLSLSAWSDLFERAKRDGALYEASRLKLKNSQTNKAASYGEIYGDLVNQILQVVRAGPLDFLVDIGAGVGQVLLQASLTTLCGSFGVEIRPDLIEVGRELAGNVMRPLEEKGVRTHGNGSVELRLGDIRVPDARVLRAIQQATIVFINNVVFDEALNQSIVNVLARELRDGARVVCFSNFFPRQREASRDPLLSRFHFPPFEFVSAPNSASWTASALHYYVYTLVPACPSAHMSDWLAKCKVLASTSIDPFVAAERTQKKRKKQDAPEDIARRISSLFMDLFVDGKVKRVVFRCFSA